MIVNMGDNENQFMAHKERKQISSVGWYFGFKKICCRRKQPQQQNRCSKIKVTLNLDGPTFYLVRFYQQIVVTIFNWKCNIVYDLKTKSKPSAHFYYYHLGVAIKVAYCKRFVRPDVRSNCSTPFLCPSVLYSLMSLFIHPSLFIFI